MKSNSETAPPDAIDAEAAGAGDISDEEEERMLQEMVQEFLAKDALCQPPANVLVRYWDELYRSHVKRLFDFVAGTILLIATSPILIAAYLAIRLTSKGDGFFAQERVGLGGELFRVYKLRSMYLEGDAKIGGAEGDQRDDKGMLYADAEKGIMVKDEADPRITPVGRFIRKTSIDELPQIWNVVKGDMSLVGPRPLVPEMVAPFPELGPIRCRVRPGITGEWQINDRANNTSMAFMIPYDMEYVHNVSLSRDLRILLMTPKVVCDTRGAH